MAFNENRRATIFTVALIMIGSGCAGIRGTRDESRTSVPKGESWRIENTAEANDEVLLVTEDQIILLTDSRRACSLSVQENSVINQVVVEDLDGDGESEIFALIGRPDRKTSEGLSLIWCVGESLVETKSWSRAEHEPWKLAAADIDGDGTQELALAVITRSPRTGMQENQLNIFDFVDGDLYPKWFCARDFVDFEFAVLNNAERLITAERISHERYALVSYRWEGFGYVRDRILCLTSDPVIKEVLPCVQ
jgi:hypothetical protein